jgi:flavodoxin
LKSVVIYLSKSGNTKRIAEAMAKTLRTNSLPLNLFTKKGRGTKEERMREAELYDQALETCSHADLVIIGTPTHFQTAHSKVLRFVRDVRAKRVGLFCTYYNKIGTTLTALTEKLKKNKIKVIGTAKFSDLKQGQLGELDKRTLKPYIDKAKEFAATCRARVKP